MFCPECGKQNKDSARFCAYCGTELIDNQPGLPNAQSKVSFGDVFTEKIKPFVVKHKLPIIIVTAMLTVCLVLGCVGSSLTTPEHVVNSFMSKMKSSDYSEAYQYLDLEESDFVNKDMFVAYAKSSGADFSSIKKYSVEEYEYNQGYSYDDELFEYLGSNKNIFSRLFSIFTKRGNKSSDSKDDSVKWYTVKLILKDSTEEQSIRIKVVKQDKKQWLFFPSYKIEAENMVTSFSLSVVDGAEVKMDGIQLTKSDEENSYGLAQYEIPKIFIGNHTVVASMHDCEDYEKEIVISDYDNSLAIESFEIKPELKEKLDASAKEIVKEFFLSAFSKKSYDSLSFRITSNESAVQDLKETYDDIVNKTNKDDGTGYKNLSFKSFGSETSQESIGSEGMFYSQITFKYSYTEMYKSYFSEEITEYDYNNQSGYVTVDFTYENGEWVLWSISRYRI